MRNLLKKCSVVLLLLSFFVGLPLIAQAREELAKDITSSTTITSTCYEDASFLYNGNVDTYRTADSTGTITLENPQGIGGIYLLFDLEYGAYTVTDLTTGKSFTAGEQGFLHEFLDLQTQFGTAPTSVCLDFSTKKPKLSEIYAFSSGKTPDFVQRWDAPLDGKADMVLFCTHGDDDHLFFAGLLPLYAAERGYDVQVVYMTDHRNLTFARTHEMLNGLWTVGVTAYPVFGSFADFLIEDLQQTYDCYLNTYGTTKEDLLSFVVEQLRRFRPQVVVGHDIQGEYGHGMHMVYTDLLIKALDVVEDKTKFPESAEKYGTWQMKKLYLHLYEENPVVLNYDEPLERFGGMTAFEVSQKLGYPCHKSQQWTWFTGWINGKKTPITLATQIEKYNPCYFGLYYSAVGKDVVKNDLFENIVSYAEQERLEQERLEQERLEQERLEQERLEQERLEQERLEQERLEQERLEQERLEQERLEKEEADRLAAEKAQQAAKKAQLRRLLILLAVLFVALILAICRLLGRKQKREKIFEKN